VAFAADDTEVSTFAPMDGDAEVPAGVRADPAGDRSARNSTIARPRRIGELLVERELISPSDLDAVLELQRKTGRRLGETVIDLGLVSPGDFARVLAERLGVEFVELGETMVDPVVAQAVPEDLARRYSALPIRRRGDEVTIVLAEPNDVFAIDDIGMVLNASIVPVLADPGLLQATINRVWAGTIESTVHAASDDVEHVDETVDLQLVSEEAPIVRMVNSILTQAVADRASDVHLEPTANRVRVRFRVDGVLHDTSEAPLSVHRPAISRLKIMAGIDIAKTRVPQDGRFTVDVDDRAIDVRVATLPTAHGEAMVLRLLDRRAGVFGLDALGLLPDELARYRKSFQVAQGQIMTSGPTGSGKTSTLYATLLEIDHVSQNVVALEDPIEYRIEGVKQMQVNTRAGITFPVALRSILRADPDVILVGEIRDRETAQIASEASLTGHLVLSTIHTSSAAAVPLRLIDMGVEPFLVTAALSTIVGQRLVRRLCEHCAEPDQPDAATRAAFRIPDSVMDNQSIRRAVGCGRCGGTGYHDRVGIYELLQMTDGIRRLVHDRAGRSDIERWAVSEGMDTLHMAALHRLAEGTIGVDELARVMV
jgi:type IV pilus assembly protein PilB